MGAWRTPSVTQDGADLTDLENRIDALESVTPVAQYGNYLVQGGGVNYLGTGFNYTVSAATYVIGGVDYASPQTNLSLGASDPTNPRIDVIAVTSAGTAIIIPGTPAASPVKPEVDSLSQLEVSFVFVAAGAVSPTVTNLNIYLNNAEWTAVSNSARIVVNSASNPFAGALDIEATAAVAGDTVTLSNGAPVTLNVYNNLTMQLRSKATWASQKRLQFQWRRGTAAVGVPVQVRTGVYGFNSATVGTYQSISIPIADFGVGTNTADNLFISVVGGGAAFGWYLDNIIAQAGVQAAADTSGEDMTFKGAYNATTAYNAQDTVTSGGTTYVALQPGTGNTPASSPLFWAAVTQSSVQCIAIACSDETTALTAGVAKVTFRMPYGFTLLPGAAGVRASLTTAPTGSVLTVDINEAGASILSTKLTIDATEKTSTTAATPAVISDTSLADDAEMTIDIDGVGSTIAGAGLKVYLIGNRT